MCLINVYKRKFTEFKNHLQFSPTNLALYGMILIFMASLCFELKAFNLHCTVGSHRHCHVDSASLAHAASFLVVFLTVALSLILILVMLVRLTYNLVCWTQVAFYSLL